MNKLITLAALALISTGALASNVTDDQRSDMLYGDTPVHASIGSAYVQNGPVAQDISTDLVYGNNSDVYSAKAEPFERISNSLQDISTDIVHGG